MSTPPCTVKPVGFTPPPNAIIIGSLTSWPSAVKLPMSLRRIFVDAIDGKAASVGGERAHHLVRVARLKTGEKVEVTDQKKIYVARVLPTADELIKFKIEKEIEPHPSERPITLFLSIVKFARFEWAIEKTTELGVNRIIPLVAEHSNRRLAATAEKRLSRWKRIADEAAQQARRMAPSHIEMPIDFGQIAMRKMGSITFMLDRGGDPLLAALEKLEPDNSMRELAFLVGPEGGWSASELEMAQCHGFITASLGANVLRTETAAVAALASSIKTYSKE